MLYLDASWCHREHVRNTGLRKLPYSDIVTYSSGVLFQQIMQIISRLYASPLAGIESALMYSQNRRFSQHDDASQPAGDERNVIGC